MSYNVLLSIKTAASSLIVRLLEIHKKGEEMRAVQKLKGIIMTKGERGFTFLKKIFVSIDHIQNDYNWLITGHECYPQNREYAKLLSEKYCWITGKELTEIVENEDFQWIWGVFSGFSKDIPQEAVLEHEFPKADGYKGIWENPVSIQHPLADIEIIAWDSSMTIVIAKDNKIADLLQKSYSGVEDLENYNNNF